MDTINYRCSDLRSFGSFLYFSNLFSKKGPLLNMSCNYNSLASNFVAKDEKINFDSVLPELIRDLTDASKSQDIPDIRDWFSKVLHYNVSGGKNVRGLNVIFSYKLLSSDINAENIKLSYVLGWCVEMLQSFFLVIDDVQDESETRRGLPAWYKLEEVGTASAINDGMLIEQGIYKILKMYFKDKPYYVDLVELFHDTTLKTLYGQGLDLMTAKWGHKRNFDRFTADRYFTIIKYKTAYYTFHLPVALALNMAGIRDKTVHDASKTVLLEIGKFFQIQDDYLDCFGDSDKTGKIGNDIKEGKCTWLAVNALNLADSHQSNVFHQNYGSDDPVKVAAIKQLYVDLKLPEMYKTYEEEANRNIMHSVHNLKGVPHDIFTNLMKILYKRIS